MKKTLCTFCFCLLTSTLFAQDKAIGGLSPKVGTVISVLTSKVLETSNPRYGLLLGLAGSLELPKSKIVLQGEVLFTQSGGKRDDYEVTLTVRDPSNNLVSFVEYNTGFNTRLNHLEIPLLVGKRFSKQNNRGFRAMLGPVFNFNLKAQVYLDTEPPQGTDVDRLIDIREDVNTSQFNIMMLLGYDWKRFKTEVRILPSLSDLFTQSPGGQNDQRVSALQVALGWDLL